MPSPAFEFTDSHRVAVSNLELAYDAWLAAARAAAALDFVFQVKRQTYKDTTYDYLYRMTDTAKGLGHSLGRVTPELDALRARHEAMKQTALADEAARYAQVQAECRQYRALRLGLISSEAAAILRLMDVYGFTGHRFMVVGTNAMAAYENEAGARFAVDVEATKDFDMTWSGGKVTLFAGAAPPTPWDPAALLGLASGDPLLEHLNARPKSLRALLKRLDDTYTLNTERPFQIRNRAGYEVEVLLAKSHTRDFPRSEELSPIPLPEQDWLLEGKQIVRCVVGRDATPARIVAPDPRWFGLQKLWLSNKPARDALKKPKDRRQGTLVLDAVQQYMPHFPLDAEFIATLPTPLEPLYREWKKHAKAQGVSENSPGYIGGRRRW